MKARIKSYIPGGTTPCKIGYYIEVRKFGFWCTYRTDYAFGAVIYVPTFKTIKKAKSYAVKEFGIRTKIVSSYD